MKAAHAATSSYKKGEVEIEFVVKYPFTVTAVTGESINIPTTDKANTLKLSEVFKNTGLPSIVSFSIKSTAGVTIAGNVLSVTKDAKAGTIDITATQTGTSRHVAGTKTAKVALNSVKLDTSPLVAVAEAARAVVPIGGEIALSEIHSKVEGGAFTYKYKGADKAVTIKDGKLKIADGYKFSSGEVANIEVSHTATSKYNAKSISVPVSISAYQEITKITTGVSAVDNKLYVTFKYPLPEGEYTNLVANDIEKRFTLHLGVEVQANVIGSAEAIGENVIQLAFVTDKGTQFTVKTGQTLTVSYSDVADVATRVISTKGFKKSKMKSVEKVVVNNRIVSPVVESVNYNDNTGTVVISGKGFITVSIEKGKEATAIGELTTAYRFDKLVMGGENGTTTMDEVFDEVKNQFFMNGGKVEIFFDKSSFESDRIVIAFDKDGEAIKLIQARWKGSATDHQLAVKNGWVKGVTTTDKKVVVESGAVRYISYRSNIAGSWFNEDPIKNDGTVDGWGTVDLYGGLKFTGDVNGVVTKDVPDNWNFKEDTHYVITDGAIPEGLRIEVRKRTDNLAVIHFKGAAKAHEKANNVSFKIKWRQDAFSKLTGADFEKTQRKEQEMKIFFLDKTAFDSKYTISKVSVDFSKTANGQVTFEGNGLTHGFNKAMVEFRLETPSSIVEIPAPVRVNVAQDLGTATESTSTKYVFPLTEATKAKLLTIFKIDGVDDNGDGVSGGKSYRMQYSGKDAFASGNIAVQVSGLPIEITGSKYTRSTGTLEITGKRFPQSDDVAGLVAYSNLPENNLQEVGVKAIVLGGILNELNDANNDAPIDFDKVGIYKGTAPTKPAKEDSDAVKKAYADKVNTLSIIITLKDILAKAGEAVANRNVDIKSIVWTETRISFAFAGATKTYVETKYDAVDA